jgi:hypothetical protein
MILRKREDTGKLKIALSEEWPWEDFKDIS